MRPFFIPLKVSAVLSRLPQYPHSLIFARAINLALGAKLQDPVWQPLHGKQISIRVRDAGIAFHFTLDQNGLAARQASAQPDLAISASAQDFVLLALRKEDPDTLFFSRRLVMEGDTELGLLVKNTLDGMELPPLDFRSLLPAHLFGKLRARLLA
ncbi:MAG: SCP2 sterol-binding domain-containing protein [Sulfurimicrobium sp.]|jgi:predicted lipid carrier protein YhbT|nr:SCP2 sterol-binding domain-containing protein [Sulfurimicrobium sp.]MDZ7657045.1 SCP2 sterol-binding domain-containing protein [Sulfurimicrobium sp.]